MASFDERNTFLILLVYDNVPAIASDIVICVNGVLQLYLNRSSNIWGFMPHRVMQNIAM